MSESKDTQQVAQDTQQVSQDTPQMTQQLQETRDLIDRCEKGDNNAMDKMIDILLLINNMKGDVTTYIKEKKSAYANTLFGFKQLKWNISKIKETEEIFINNMKECIYAYIGMTYVYLELKRDNIYAYAQHALKSGCNIAYIPLSRYEYDIKNYDKSLEYATKAVEHGIMSGYFRQGMAYQSLGKEKEAFECYSKGVANNCYYSKQEIKKSPKMMEMTLDEFEKQSKIKSDNENLRKRLTTSLGDFASQSLDLHMLIKQRDDITQKYEELKKIHNDNTLNEEITKLKDLLDKKTSEYETLNKQYETYKGKYDDQTEYIKSLKSDLDNMTEAYGGLKIYCDDLTKRYCDLTKKYCDLTETHNKLVETKSNDIESDGEIVDKETIKIKEQNDILIKDNDALERKVMFLSTQNNALIEKIMKLENNK
jgi:hypothetical protein